MDAEKLANIIMESGNTVFFGGAGVSTASGIPDFRSAEGVFSKRLNQTLTPEDMISHTFYERFPEEFFRFYKSHLIYPDAKPNACHFALADLEKAGRLSSVITQNIDGLHQLAGSGNVIELHGSIHRNYCEACRGFYALDYILSANGVPQCEKCGGRVKPDVVLYEESLDTDLLRKATDQIARADTLIVGGTSLIVYPAAGLLQYFQGENCVLINKNATRLDARADLVINDDIAQVFRSVMDRLDPRAPAQYRARGPAN